MSDVVIVTGAASGLGAVYCRELSAAGYTVVGADVAPVDGVDLAVAVDVADREGTERLAEQVLERFGRIDALVNNAAVYSSIVKKPFEEITDEEWDDVMGVNVKGAWLCARAVAPAMRRQRRGKIVNVSSTTVPTAPPGFAHYVASKAAIVGLTRALARELGPDGICVNTLTPDYIAFDRDYDNRQPDMASGARRAADLRPRANARGHGRRSPVPRRPRLRLRHGAGHLGERRSRLPLGGRTRRRDLAGEPASAVDFLACTLPLAAGEAYNFDTWTDPAFRGLGVASASGARLNEALAAEGVRTVHPCGLAGERPGPQERRA